ncbi:MAG: hypothetical protein HY055_00330 [Magnetospirillum sp.]|nr:hypothetical protein [Magnetospirillum sp.]
MAGQRNLGRTSEGRTGVPFATTADAVVWYIQCQSARDGGARFTSGLGQVPRPCAPDDIAREVLRLHRRKILRLSHLRIMGRLGRLDSTQIPCPHEIDLWNEALDRLSTPLRTKGIVE